MSNNRSGKCIMLFSNNSLLLKPLKLYFQIMFNNMENTQI